MEMGSTKSVAGRLTQENTNQHKMELVQSLVTIKKDMLELFDIW